MTRLWCEHETNVDDSDSFQSRDNRPTTGSCIMLLFNNIYSSVESIGLIWFAWGVFVSVILISWCYWCNSRYVRLVNAIPGPKGIPIIGNVLEVNVNQVGMEIFHCLHWQQIVSLNKLPLFNRILAHHPSRVACKTRGNLPRMGRSSRHRLHLVTWTDGGLERDSNC